jgi:molybdopterin-guanine dinucleotide biosynthesis protein A
MNIGGIILCGGRSRRMGVAKAWLPIAGETLLARTVRIVSEVVSPVVVVAAVGQELPPLPAEIEILHDEVSDRGPLGGLATGLAALAGQIDAAYLSACDLPNLNRPTIHFLVHEFSPAILAAVAQSDRGLHPLSAVYAVSLLSQIRERVSAGHLRMSDLIQSIPHRAVPVPDVRSLVNLNTMTEYLEYLSTIAPESRDQTDPLLE